MKYMFPRNLGLLAMVAYTFNLAFWGAIIAIVAVAAKWALS